MKTPMDRIGYRVPPVPVTEEIQLSVIMTHGFCGRKKDREASDYWYRVWEWLDSRYPDLFVSGEFPDDWHTDANHEKDMDVLSCIHTWQRHMAVSGRVGVA